MEPIPPDGGPGLDAGPDARDARADAPVDASSDVDADAAPAELSAISLSPPNQDQNVGVRDPVRVTFSEPVKLGAAPLSLFTRDNVPIPSSATLSEDGRTLTVTPEKPFAAPSEVYATFGDVSGVDGKPLKAPPSWSWKVPRWHAMAKSSYPSLAVYPDVSAAPNGQTAVSYLGQDENYKPRYYVSVLDEYDGTWKRLGDLNVPDTIQPTAVRYDSQGAPVVFLPEQLMSRYRMRALRWTGTGWSNVGYPFAANCYFGNDAYSPAMGINGSMFLACQESRPGNETDLVVWSFDGTQWRKLGTSVQDRATEGDGYSPTVAVDKSGVPYVSYTVGERFGGKARAHVRKWSGSGWTRVGADISTPEGPAAMARMVFNDADVPFALVTVDAVSPSTVRVLRFDGAKWIPIGGILARSAHSLCLAAGRNGHVLAAWRPNDDPDPIGLADVTPDGWTSMEGPSRNHGFYLALTVDREGLPLVGMDGVFRINR